MKPSNKIPKWMKTVICVLIIILALCLICFGYFWKKLDLINYEDEAEIPLDSVTTEPYIVDVEQDYIVDIEGLEISETLPSIPESDVKQDDEVVNILLIGTDERSKDFNDRSRSDCMILVSINKGLKTVRLVSFERGIGVPILEGNLAGEYDLLTHVFRWGGADLLVKTIEHCFKIEIDHYVRMNFSSVKNIVNAVGGINLDLSSREAAAINKDEYGESVVVRSGMNHVNGRTALAYARLRSIDSDWVRVGRQRKVILAVVDQLKDASLIELNDLADEVLPMIQTNMDKLDIAELVLYAPDFLNSQFDQLTIPKKGTYGGMAIRNNGGAFAVDYEINNDLLYRFLYEGVSSEVLLAEPAE